MHQRRAVGSAALVACVGLLAGCPTVDLGDVPGDPALCRPNRAYFDSDIWPKYLAPAGGGVKSCVATAGCHNEANGRSAFRLDASAMPDLALNYTATTRFLLCSTPDASPLLLKPLAGDTPHGGGDLFQMSDPEVQTFLGWFP